MGKLEELPKESLISEIEQMREDYKTVSGALKDKEKRISLLEDKIEVLRGVDSKNDRLLAIIERQSESMSKIIDGMDVNVKVDQW